MPWSTEQQTQYSKTLGSLVSEYSEAYTIWTNTIKDSARDPSLQPEANKAAAQVSSILQKMRIFVRDLQRASSDAISQGDVLQKINDLATQIAEEKIELAKLLAVSGTRDEQSHSLNPRSTPSPYTNILGLNRVFRDSTRFTIMILSVLFGAFSLGLIIYLMYKIAYSSPGFSGISGSSGSSGIQNPNQGVAVGGSRRTHK